jgi:hypothetical protein
MDVVIDNGMPCLAERNRIVELPFRQGQPMPPSLIMYFVFPNPYG